MRTTAFWLSLIFIFTIPWENLVVLPGLGTVGRTMGILTALFWVAAVITSGQVRRFHLFHFALILFVLWNVASVFWSADVEGTGKRLLTYLQLVGLVFLAWDLYPTRSAIKAGLQAYVLGAYVTAFTILSLYFAQGRAFSRDQDVANFNIDTIGGILAMALPIAWHLATSAVEAQPRFLRWLNFAYVPISIFGIVLTSSRSAFGSIFVAGAFMLMSLLKLKRSAQLSVVAVLLCLGLMMQPFLPKESVDRLAGTSTEVAEGNLNGRGEIWQEGMVVFRQHSWIGVGSNSYPAVTPTGKKPHNLAFSILVELGVVGCALFLWMLGTVLQQTIRQPKLEAAFWLTVLIIWAIGALSHNYEDSKETWLFFSWAVASANLAPQVNALLRQRL